MTGFYEFFSLPDRVEVVCPLCDGCATFTYAHVLQIEKKMPIYLKTSSLRSNCLTKDLPINGPACCFFLPYSVQCLGEKNFQKNTKVLRLGSIGQIVLLRTAQILALFVVINVWQNRNINLNGPKMHFIQLNLKAIYFGHSIK